LVRRKVPRWLEYVFRRPVISIAGSDGLDMRALSNQFTAAPPQTVLSPWR